MYNQTLHRDRKHFHRSFLQSFRTAQIFDQHVDNIFKSNGKQMIKMAKKEEIIKFKNYMRKYKNETHTIYDLKLILKLFYYQKGLESKSRINIMQIYIKVMLVAVCVIT